MTKKSSGILLQLLSIVISIIVLFSLFSINSIAQYGAVPDVNNPDFGTSLADFPNEPAQAVIENVSGAPGQVLSTIAPVAGISNLDFTFKNNVTNGRVGITIDSVLNLPGQLPSGEPLTVISMNFENMNANDIDTQTTFKLTPQRRNQYENLSAFIFNSPGQEVGINYLGSDSEGNLVYETNSIGYQAFAVSGQGGSLDGSLFRTGGEFTNLSKTLGLSIFAVALFSFVCTLKLQKNNSQNSENIYIES